MQRVRGPPRNALRQVVMLMVPLRTTVDRLDMEEDNSGTLRIITAAEISTGEDTFLTIASAPASAVTISFTSAIRL
jgi:hypothetical protein